MTSGHLKLSPSAGNLLDVGRFYTFCWCWDWDDLYIVLGVLEGGVSVMGSVRPVGGSTVGRIVGGTAGLATAR